AAKIKRQQHEADDEASDDVSHDNLKKREVGVVGEAGNADDGERAGFGGYDREHDRPPGNVSVGEKIIFERLLALAEAQAEKRDCGEIDRDDGEVERVQSHE